MVRTRVAEILDEIAELSPVEKAELARSLPAVGENDFEGGGHPLRLLDEIRAHREQVRARLLAEGKPSFSISDDIEAMRAERDAELPGEDPAR